MTYKVYKLLSPSGRAYIGYTKNTLAIRWSGHLSNWKIWQTKRNRAGMVQLYYAFEKYPPELWTKEIIFESEDQQEALTAEIRFIEQFNTIKDGYNTLPGGFGGAGKLLTEEHKANLSKGRKAYYETDEGKEWLESISTGRTPYRKPGQNIRGSGEDVQLRSSLAKENYIKGRTGLRSPKIGEYSRTEDSKDNMSDKSSAHWNITDPYGHTILVTNLKKWAVDLGFNPAYSQSNISRTGSYKGYKAIKVWDPREKR